MKIKRPAGSRRPERALAVVMLAGALFFTGCNGDESPAAASLDIPAEVPATTTADDSAAVKAFVDDFLAAREQDRRSDLSRAHFAAELEQTRDDLARLRSIDPAQLSFDDRLDWKFARSILRGR